MQTFLPYSNFEESARALDNKRLNKQILEGYQILKVLNNPDPKAAWRNHPAVRMWDGSETFLYKYIMAMAQTATARGIKTDKNLANILELKSKTFKNWGSALPAWYSEEKTIQRLTESHRANLYRKDPEYYDIFRNDNANPCCDKCQYFWVTHEGKK
jgi:hypothetical protein